MVGSDRRLKKLRFELKALRKLTDLSVGAGQQRPGMEKASILIEILWKTNGFERRGGSGATRDGKSFNFNVNPLEN